MLACWGTASVLQAQWQTQTLTLQPGWNPVYLSVAPVISDCDAIFGGNARILSVRRWAPPPIEAVQYDEVTGAIIPQYGSWLTWFPPNHPDRPLLNLAEFQTGAYLIEVSAGPQVSAGPHFQCHRVLVGIEEGAHRNFEALHHAAGVRCPLRTLPVRVYEPPSAARIGSATFFNFSFISLEGSAWSLPGATQTPENL